MGNVLLGWAAIILAIAAPFVIAFGLLAMLGGGIGAVVRGLARGDRLLLLGGLVAATLAAAIGYAGLRWLAGPSMPMPELVRVERAARYGGPLPRIFVGDDWQAMTLAGPLIDGRFYTRVLADRPVRTSATGWSDMTVAQRAERWEEYVLRSDGDCARSGAVRSFACTQAVAMIVPGGILSEPYVREQQRDIRGANGKQVRTTWYVVDGRTSLPILTCGYTQPTSPLAGLFDGHSATALQRAYADCRHRARTTEVFRALAAERR